MKVNSLDKIGKPYKIYAEVLDPAALEQFRATMEQDCITQGALMPDAHKGYTLPIGGVVATNGVVFPSFVGFDIGCGMSALPLTFSPEEIRANQENIFDAIYRKVPTGFKVNQHSMGTKLQAQDLSDEARECFWAGKGFKALGTLGGGNHFIEVGEDSDDQTWIIIHSGSRGVGWKIAEYYMKLASPDGKAREGHFGFREDSPEGEAYINDLKWGLEFALENRTKMMERTVAAIQESCEGHADWKGFINRNHNHAEKRDDVWIHRKGATHAEAGMDGVIPGNMRDGSFIVKGKGNPESLYSSSHGAGRVLGRKQARRELNLEDFETTMEGIKARVSDKTLDEAPGAYKNIFEVMDLQKDLVDVITHVKPIINIKG